MTREQERNDLLEKGQARVALWCHCNGVDAPGLKVVPRENWRVDACAYYRPQTTKICLEACANKGYAARAWSWPGYVIDRTPYGVVAHELGHHVDWLRSDRRGAYFGDFSARVRKAAKEEKLTGYCPNDAEWFAEMFRLFVTNPDLLCKVRPNTYATLRKVGLEPIAGQAWDQVLAGAPERTLAQARKKMVVDDRLF